MAAFDPDERHMVASESGAKILLILAPWPGAGTTAATLRRPSSWVSGPRAAGTCGTGTSPSRS
jgi:hypothetical protein